MVYHVPGVLEADRALRNKGVARRKQQRPGIAKNDENKRKIRCDGRHRSRTRRLACTWGRRHATLVLVIVTLVLVLLLALL